MANTKISALTANTNPNWNEEFVYAYNNANGKITLNTMKTFVWWAGITTLNADANIWELSEWIYITEHDLYYKSWETVPVIWGTWAVKKQMLFVTYDGWTRWYLCFNAWNKTSTYISRCSFWYSTSASDWVCKRIENWDASLEQYWYLVGSWESTVDGISSYSLTQILDNVEWTETLNVDSINKPYPWVTYTILINSVASGQNYSIALWTWVTNPFGVALPSASTKKSIITLLITSSTTAIITWCTIAS